MEQESKSMEIRRWRISAIAPGVHNAINTPDGGYVRYADHAAALKAAQDAIAVEHRALLEANKAVFEDITERQRLLAQIKVMREAILWANGEGDDFPERKPGQGAYWWRTELMRRSGIRDAALASTAPAAATCSKPAAALVPRLGLSWACVLTKGHTGNCQPGGSCRAHGPYVGTPHCPHPVEECVRILMDRSTAPVAEAGQKEGE